LLSGKENKDKFIPKFVVDVMLGSLSRWLRLFGFDTFYRNDLTDKDLIKISLQDRRILLTKDNALAKSKILKNVLLISSEKLELQLKEVLTYLRKNKIEILILPPRCPLCNGEMTPVQREEVITEVPDYISMTTNQFLKCKACGKIYWHGSHKEKIEYLKNKILKDLEIKDSL
jgi:uncharacterized protein with PIN domain